MNVLDQYTILMLLRLTLRDICGRSVARNSRVKQKKTLPYFRCYKLYRPMMDHVELGCILYFTTFCYQKLTPIFTEIFLLEFRFFLN